MPHDLLADNGFHHTGEAIEDVVAVLTDPVSVAPQPVGS